MYKCVIFTHYKRGSNYTKIVCTNNKTPYCTVPLGFQSELMELVFLRGDDPKSDIRWGAQWVMKTASVMHINPSAHGI